MRAAVRSSDVSGLGARSSPAWTTKDRTTKDRTTRRESGVDRSGRSDGRHAPRPRPADARSRRRRCSGAHRVASRTIGAAPRACCRYCDALAHYIPIAIVSGRSVDDLEHLYAFPGDVVVVGSHGLETRGGPSVELDENERVTARHVAPLSHARRK